MPEREDDAPVRNTWLQPFVQCGTRRVGITLGLVAVFWEGKLMVLLKLSKSDGLIYLGESENGFVFITNGDAEGWADVRFLTQ